MESLLDPASLRGQEGVEFRDERCVDDREGFDDFASIDGLVAVGITNRAGAILLMNSPHGWRVPYGPVDPAENEDWVAVGRRIGAELTGVDVSISRAERVGKITHRLEDGFEDGGREGTARETTSYDVVLRSTPVTGEPVADDPSFDPWDDLELEWFDAVPNDAYWDHGDAVDDIRTFLE
ncbi:hypothetical protein [Natronoglomus mannanivorans]|uniref:NUDIX domain-containing protein n=1 Tax=Natronoglomus mannanivorans TaxID=2979990 RepID=A0AAP2Z2F2_9EURY|nr:NUDIX domain-containing protein [Halobacteria archaeon AArc-xg1-1]